MVPATPASAKPPIGRPPSTLQPPPSTVQRSTKRLARSAGCSSSMGKRGAEDSSRQPGRESINPVHGCLRKAPHIWGVAHCARTPPAGLGGHPLGRGCLPGSIIEPRPGRERSRAGNTGARVPGGHGPTASPERRPGAPSRTYAIGDGVRGGITADACRTSATAPLGRPPSRFVVRPAARVPGGSSPDDPQPAKSSRAMTMRWIWFVPS